jgi:Holliday junction resolvase
MPKTLVNIITDDNPIPAYLFIKEMYEAGDRIMYISAKATEDDLEWLAVIDGVPSENMTVILLKNDIDEFRYEKICRVVRNHLVRGVHYYVNLAGGTRYMALAVQQVFESFDATFFYVNLEDNTIVKSKFDDSIYDDDDFSYPIRYRMKISEYLQAHELEHDLFKTGHAPEMLFSYAENMFTLFSQNLLANQDYRVMETLRLYYRNCKQDIPISEIESPLRSDRPAIPDIRNFLEITDIQCHKDKLSHAALEWITGGWFEDYLYYRIKELVQPDDLALRVRIARKGARKGNELDVLFMKDNQLFVVECKTGVQTESMFSEIVYKACALKEALLGVSCHSYIASLKQDKDDNLKKIAKNMGITFWDYNIMTKMLEKILNGVRQMRF